MAGGLRPVKRYEVGEGHMVLRIVLLVLSVMIALTAFGYGIHSLLNKNNGWRTVEVNADRINCSTDFTLQYNFGAAGISATAEYKLVSALYSEAAEDAYELFYSEGVLLDINAAPNTVLEVDPALYAVFEMIQAAGDRCLYLASVYEEYERIFQYENEDEAAIYDPGQNQEVGEYVAQAAAYGNDPAMVDLELQGDNRICLYVSEEYLAFAEENGIEEFIDFGWMKNAFIADYIADTLAEDGYTLGYLVSYDGFTRNLDGSGQTYSFNLFDRLDNQIYMPAVMEYSGPMSIVFLRNYPLGEVDRWHYFPFSNGRIATSFISPESGMSVSSTDNLVGYSRGEGCGELLLKLTPIFLREELDEAALDALPEQGVEAIWFEDTLLKHTDPDLKLTATDNAREAGYQIP